MDVVDLQKRLDAISAVMDREAPAKEPFRYKYEAQRLIDELVSNLATTQTQASLDLQAVLLIVKGKLYSEVEEFSRALESILPALCYLACYLASPEVYACLCSLAEGEPRLISEKLPSGSPDTFEKFWSFFSISYNAYSRSAGLVDAETEIRAEHSKKMHERFTTEPVEADIDDPFGYAAELTTGLIENQDEMVQLAGGDAFMTEADILNDVRATEVARNLTPVRFTAEEALGDMANVLLRTLDEYEPVGTHKRLQLIPFVVLALNCVGVIWANRGMRDTALATLKAAELLLNSVDKDNPYLIREEPMDANKKPLHVHLLTLPGGANEEEGVKNGLSKDLPVCNSRTLSDLGTHTMYFLAQVYGDKDPDKAAEYCSRTILSQYTLRILCADGFDARDFITNCLNLQKFYVNNNLLRQASVLLDTAESVLVEFGPDEQWVTEFKIPDLIDATAVEALRAHHEALLGIQRIKASIDTETALELRAQIHAERGHFHTQILSLSYNSMQEKEDPNSPQPITSYGELTAQFSGQLACTTKPRSEISAPECLLTESLAETVFAVGSQYIRHALKYFVLDGFVSDHCQLLLDISAMAQVYSYIIDQEHRGKDDRDSIIGRLIKIHQKRIVPIEAAIKELSADHYSRLIATLEVEAAEIRTTVFHTFYGRVEALERAKKAVEDMDFAAQIILKQIEPLTSDEEKIIATAAAYCSRAIETRQKACALFEACGRQRFLQEHAGSRHQPTTQEALAYLTFEDRDALQNGFFEAAKLLSHLPTYDPVKKVLLLEDALQLFRRVEQMWKEHESLYKKEESLRLIETMASLLEKKIEQVHNVVESYGLKKKA
ncbi:KIF-1 binding protein C terminal-containing protein [Giardia muris]|uniref:KIF-binding protein n=1 Tax=Giardia muris TaxID=5742 RepID=A0A4Z1STI0_GIAMU|nr:KIF-1 binding protein C terminal-containing protein [Giardia muris]|eukprot:TNJ29060.1 KIF-1 binding protein C terminal-containing protein [Giardia muris]